MPVPIIHAPFIVRVIAVNYYNLPLFSRWVDDYISVVYFIANVVVPRCFHSLSRCITLRSTFVPLRSTGLAYGQPS